MTVPTSSSTQPTLRVARGQGQGQAERRLPGITFQLQPPPLSDVLPRMDVAVFVGFATRGPLDTPVAVEDTVQFTAIFGEDVLLAWDGQQGTAVYAYLASTVRAFFRNGGKRCWVIRVAGAQAAFNYFPVPGLVRVKLGEDGNVLSMAPAFARACSRGSWSDGLRVGASLSVQPLLIDSLPSDALASDTPTLTLTVGSPDDVMVGDLLRLTYGQQGQEGATVQMVVVDEVTVLNGSGTRSARKMVQPAPSPRSASQQRVKLQIACRRVLWLSTQILSNQPPVLQTGYICSHSVDDITAQVQLFDTLQAVDTSLQAVFAQLSESIPSLGDSAPFQSLESQVSRTFRAVPILSTLSDLSDNQQMSLVLDLSYNDAPEPGTILYVPAQPASLWLTIRDVEEIHLPDQLAVRRVKVTGEGYWVLPGMPSPPPSFSSFMRIEQLKFSLSVQQNSEQNVQLQQDALTFDMRHPRCWNALPTDQQLYGDPDMLFAGNGSENTDIVHKDLWLGASEPRFLLSGSSANVVLLAPEQDELFLPIGMPQVFLDHFLGVDEEDVLNSISPLERDGLDQFSSALFLDADMVSTPVIDVLEQADFLQYQYDQVRSLKGIYAALAVEEATLIAVPDAVHRGWYKNTEAQGQPQGSALHVGRGGHGERGLFSDCPPRADAPLLLDAHIISNRAFILSWKAAETMSDDESEGDREQETDRKGQPYTSETVSYILQESLRADFKQAIAVYEGPEQSVTLYGRDLGVYYYRVQQSVPLISEWSRSVTVQTGSHHEWLLDDVAQYDASTLIAVQRALLRMCAARGDLFAVLSLPGQYTTDTTRVYVQRLKEQPLSPLLAQDMALPPLVPGNGSDGGGDVLSPLAPLDFPLSYAERKAFTFGALYSPWLVCREETGQNMLSTMPPDGAICGMMAQSSLKNGAWIAPANQVLTGVVALWPPTPRMSRFSDERILSTQTNLIRQNVDHMLVFSQDTLCDDEDADLRPINVRRLLMLVRRLALLLGPTYVFEPNSEDFRRSVARGFEALFSDLFLRGAFAGESPATSFQVVCDDTVNTREDVDAGNFIVELRIAPARPLTFLTIRLVQSATGSLIMET